MTSTQLLKPVADGLAKSHPGYSNSDLERAYVAAEKAHSGQLRKSGEPYITHPVAVAQILTELGMDLPTVMAALLHDTVEDTSYSIEQIKAEFGDEVTSLVDGVTKLGHIEGLSNDQVQSQNHRKIILATAKDIRVILVKLADRVHNMKTIKFHNMKQNL